MNIIEKLNKVNAEQLALEQKQKLLSDELNSLQSELTQKYGADWEQQYNTETAKLEAFDDSCSA